MTGAELGQGSADAFDPRHVRAAAAVLHVVAYDPLRNGVLTAEPPLTARANDSSAASVIADDAPGSVPGVFHGTGQLPSGSDARWETLTVGFRASTR